MLHCLLIADSGLPVCRGTWFIGAPSSPDLWQPVAEEDSGQIENSHQSIWRAMVYYMYIFETRTAITTVP